MTTQPKFEIVRIAPVYCQITDGLIGSRTYKTGRTYLTAALAHRIAGRLEEANYNDCGDDSFQVREIGSGKAHMLPWVWPTLADGTADFPF